MFEKEVRYKVGLLVISILLSVFLRAQSRSDQAVLFSNLDGKSGKLFIGWYKNAADFRKENKAVFKKIVDVNKQETVPVIFEDIPPGTYAVAVFLDENNNGKIDLNILGIPKEKYGFSNNVYPLMRPASFKESAFIVSDKEGSYTIRLKK